MTTFPVEWHENCARNRELSLQSEERELLRLTERVVEHRAQLVEYKKQINEAISRGLTKFDSERFGKKRINHDGNKREAL